MVRFVTINKAAELTGYTEDAIRTKIRDTIWREGQEWQKAPDGRILINMDGYDKWVETEGALKRPRKAALRLRSNTKGNGAASAFRSSPLPLT